MNLMQVDFEKVFQMGGERGWGGNVGCRWDGWYGGTYTIWMGVYK